MAAIISAHSIHLFNSLSAFIFDNFLPTQCPWSKALNITCQLAFCYLLNKIQMMIYTKCNPHLMQQIVIRKYWFKLNSRERTVTLKNAKPSQDDMRFPYTFTAGSNCELPQVLSLQTNKHQCDNTGKLMKGMSV